MDFLKIENFSALKNTLKKNERQSTELENIFEIYIW